VAGEVLSAAKYNADQQNHIDNNIPSSIDDYSANVTTMRTATDPGEVGSESLATTLAGEVERLRFALRELKATAQWYETGADVPLKPGDSLAAVVAAIGANVRAILITEAVDFSGTVTVPKNIALVFRPGGKLNRTATAALTVNGPVVAERFTIWQGFASGEVKYGELAAERIYPEHFGAVGDNATDDQAALAKMVAACTGTGSANTGHIVFGPRIYYVASAVTFPAGWEAITLQGSGFFASRTRLRTDNNSGTIFKFEGTGGAIGNDLEIKNLYFDHGGNGAGTKCLSFEGARIDHVSIHHCAFIGRAAGGTRYGIYLDGSADAFDFFITDNVFAFFDTNDVLFQRVTFGHILNNQFIDMAVAGGARIHLGASQGGGTLDNWIIAHNTINVYGASTGVNVAGDASARPRGIVVSGNSFEHSSTANTGTGIFVNHDQSRHVTIGPNAYSSDLFYRINSSGTVVDDHLQVDASSLNIYTKTGSRVLGAGNTAGAVNIGSDGNAIYRVRGLLNATVTPGTVNANSRAAVTASLTGVKVGDFVELVPHESLDTGLVYGGCKVTADDTVTVFLYNGSGSNITDANARTWGAFWVDLTA
jgi:hypothetical protein